MIDREELELELLNMVASKVKTPGILLKNVVIIFVHCSGASSVNPGDLINNIPPTNALQPANYDIKLFGVKLVGLQSF